MTVAPYQLQVGATRAKLRGRLKWSEEHRFHASYSACRAIGVNGSESHLTLEADQFAHGADTDVRIADVRTMKGSVFQGLTA